MIDIQRVNDLKKQMARECLKDQVSYVPCSPSEILNLCNRITALESEVERYRKVAEWYAGNFDGREGSKWNGDIFFIETKFGSTETAGGGSFAKEALTQNKVSDGGDAHG